MNKGNRTTTLWTGALALATGLLAAGTQAAEPSPAPAWVVSCVSASRAAPADCKIEQRLVAQETGQSLSLAVVSVPGATRKPVLQFLLPTGLSLPEGVTLKIDDGKPVAVPLQFCDGSGCLASLPLTPALVDSLQKGKTLTVQAVAGGSRQPYAFNHVLTDFAAAWGAAK